MNHGDLMWLAGLLEGEGTFGVYTYDRAKRGRLYRQTSWAIQLRMVDKDVVEHVADLVGGSVYEIEPRQPHHQPQWALAFGRRHDVIALVRELRPLMSARRRAAIDRMIETHEAST